MEYGLANRVLQEIEAIGVDDIHSVLRMKAVTSPTVIYQIDAGCRRLLWIGKRRTAKTLRQGLEALGPAVVHGLRFVWRIWKPYLNVLPTEAGQPCMCSIASTRQHMNQGVDQVRRAEGTRLKAKSKDEAKQLKNMRWSLLRKGSRVRGKARKKLNALIASKLDTARAWELKEAFMHFWKYKSPIWAAGFLDAWCDRALRSRLEPMQKVARMLKNHEGLLMNWFRAKESFPAPPSRVSTIRFVW